MKTQPKFEYNQNSAMLGNRAMLGDIKVPLVPVVTVNTWYNTSQNLPEKKIEKTYVINQEDIKKMCYIFFEVSKHVFTRLVTMNNE